MTELTQDLLKDLIAYDEVSGIMVRRKSRFLSKVGAPAGVPSPRGYRQVGVAGGNYPEHRLAWLYVYGYWPTGQIDHIDGDKLNNRIANLRDVSGAENMQNLLRARVNSKSGLLGVWFSKSNLRWTSRITVKGKRIVLGYFDSPELAQAAYMKAKKTLHPFSEIAK